MSTSKPFSGFPPGKVAFTSIPQPFFTDILPFVDDLIELKVILYIIWALDQRDGTIRYLRRGEMIEDQTWLAGLSEDPDSSIRLMDEGLVKAEKRGVIFTIQNGDPQEKYYLLNTARSRSLMEAYRDGQWTPGAEKFQPVGLDLIKPNVFKLYEQNIGPLTPMIAEFLKEAENDYPVEWIDEAFKIAVANNVRKWNYIQAILRSWQERGRDDENRRDTQKDYRRYIEGEFARFIEH